MQKGTFFVLRAITPANRKILQEIQAERSLLPTQTRERQREPDVRVGA